MKSTFNGIKIYTDWREVMDDTSLMWQFIGSAFRDMKVRKLVVNHDTSSL